MLCVLQLRVGHFIIIFFSLSILCKKIYIFRTNFVTFFFAVTGKILENNCGASNIACHQIYIGNLCRVRGGGCGIQYVLIHHCNLPGHMVEVAI